MLLWVFPAKLFSHPRELAWELDCGLTIYCSIPRMDFWDRKDFSSLNIRPYSSPELGILLGPLDRKLVSFLTSCKNTMKGSLCSLVDEVLNSWMSYCGSFLFFYHQLFHSLIPVLCLYPAARRDCLKITGDLPIRLRPLSPHAS